MLITFTFFSDAKLLVLATLNGSSTFSVDKKPSMLDNRWWNIFCSSGLDVYLMLALNKILIRNGCVYVSAGAEPS